jgi:hypothetical protein
VAVAVAVAVAVQGAEGGAQGGAEGDGEHAGQHREQAQGGLVLAAGAPEVQQGEVEGRALVVGGQGGEQVAPGAAGEPEADRFVQPEAALAQVVQAQGQAQGQDGGQREPPAGGRRRRGRRRPRLGHRRPGRKRRGSAPPAQEQPDAVRGEREPEGVEDEGAHRERLHHLVTTVTPAGRGSPPVAIVRTGRR